MLLCIPFVDSDGLFEKHRKFCEKQESICSARITCGCGSKENRQRKGANSSPGDHLQIPVVVKSNPDGLKMLGGEIDWARASQSNLNPSLHVCFHDEHAAGPAEGATHNLCQIHCSDVLRGNLQLRHTQLRVANNPSSKFSSLFKGTTPTTFLSKSHHLLQQLLMEVRGDSQLTRLITLEFQKGCSTTETQLLKKKLNLQIKKSRRLSSESNAASAEEAVNEKTTAGQIRQHVVHGMNKELRVGGSLHQVLDAFDESLGTFLTNFPKDWTSLSMEGVIDANQLVQNIKEAGPHAWTHPQQSQGPQRQRCPTRPRTGKCSFICLP